MNPTDEFILEAFKQQGLANDEMLEEIKSEMASDNTNSNGDQDLYVMNRMLEKT